MLMGRVKILVPINARKRPESVDLVSEFGKLLGRDRLPERQ
jgi:hypothetical protein